MAAAPPLRDRGHRSRGGEGGCRCRCLLEGRDFHPSEDRETAAGWKGNSTGTQSPRARRGVQGGEREWGEPTGPFRASPQRKLTVAATAAAADRNLSPAPRGALRRRGVGAPKRGRAEAAAGGRGGAPWNSINKGFASCRHGWGCCSPAGKGPRRLGGREAGWCLRLGPRGRKRYLHRPGGD